MRIGNYELGADEHCWTLQRVVQPKKAGKPEYLAAAKYYATLLQALRALSEQVLRDAAPETDDLAELRAEILSTIDLYARLTSSVPPDLQDSVVSRTVAAERGAKAASQKED